MEWKPLRPLALILTLGSRSRQQFQIGGWQLDAVHEKQLQIGALRLGDV